MRIVRYLNDQGQAGYGWILEDKIGPILGSPFGEFRRGDLSLTIKQTQILPPVIPSKIICVGRNYTEHVREVGGEVPDIPLLFLKPSSSVIGPGQAVILPPQSQKVEHEGELAVVIGKGGRWISTDQVQEHILGYTIANDVTARDLQRRDGQWTRGKSFDTFCPLGPWIETEFDPSDAILTCHVNQELRQMASTRDMIFSIQQLVAFISSVMTLLPGDVILTGTPSGIGPLTQGDIVKVAIEGLGELINPVQRDEIH